MSDELAAFVAARLATEEEFLRIAKLGAKTAQRERAETDAKKAILAYYTEVQAWSWPPADGDEAVQEALGIVLRHLATMWSYHPDYRAEWKP